MADLVVAPNIRTFQVFPDVPEPLQPLLDLSRNLWWVWHPDAVELFRRLDRQLWEEVYHNPVKLLGSIEQIEAGQRRPGRGLPGPPAAGERCLPSSTSKGKGWFAETHGDKSKLKVAYFSAEFGLHESLPIYSGGLGILAGDHLKSASELGLPLTAIGLLYRNGYFQQYLSADGWQQEAYPELDFYNLPIEPMPLHGRLAGARARGPAGERGLLQGLAGQRRADRRSTCSTPTSRKTPRPTATSPRGCTAAGTELRIKQEIVLGIGGDARAGGAEHRSRPSST